MVVSFNFTKAFKEKFLDALGFKHVVSDSVNHEVACTYALQMPFCQSFDLHHAKSLCEKLAKEHNYFINSSAINTIATQYRINIVNREYGLNYRIQIAVAPSDFEAVVLSFVKIELE